MLEMGKGRTELLWTTQLAAVISRPSWHARHSGLDRDLIGQVGGFACRIQQETKFVLLGRSDCDSANGQCGCEFEHEFTVFAAAADQPERRQGLRGNPADKPVWEDAGSPRDLPLIHNEWAIITS